MMIKVRHRALPSLIGAGLLLALGGCGGGSDDAADTASVASAISSLAPSGSPSPGGVPTPEAGECGSAQAEIQAGVGVSGQVTSVELFGQCTTAEVGTSLGTTPDDVDAALGICAIAVAQASSQGVTAVNVSSSDGTGLAIGLAGADCIRVPAG